MTTPLKTLPTKPSDAAPEKPDAPPVSLKRLAVTGSAWVMLGFGFGQALRLVGNVILTRLLSPDAFGMMGIVGTVRAGLGMFSDIGLRPNIIQNKRGEEATFLRTAWTMQVIRGIILAVLAAALAWPMAILNNEPRLFLIISVAGLASVISGFNSTWLLVYSRRIALAPVTILGMITHFLSLIAMVTYAWYFHTVWALVLGGFVGGIITLIASHTVLAGIVKMRFQWEPEAVRELFRFGRWIFISTALGFLTNSLDVLILGSFAGMSMLGFYVLAKNISRIMQQALMTISSKILLPVYSRLVERGTTKLRRRMFKVRAILLAVSLPPIWAFTLWGDYLIAFLYDDRYQDAGWMLQILSAGSIALAIRATIGPVLLAVGDSFRQMINIAIRLALQIIGMAAGAYIAGTQGFFIGLALSEWLSYPALVYLIRPYNVWRPLLDVLAFGSSFIVVGIALWLN
ncbi:MAG: oligosaccharide flippase family protein [Thiomargarita sp.]|nr:oligosaccharide flippase family protein [Thiomargarita sp.]